MSLDYFGKEFDIHGGGHDLRFPHHEAEICQGECHTGRYSPVVHHWLHNGFVNIDGEKMSKSLGNFLDDSGYSDQGGRHGAPLRTHQRPLPVSHRHERSLAQRCRTKLQPFVGLLCGCPEGLHGRIALALPQPDLSSPLPLSKSLGLLEKMGEGFAQAMDDDFNSREAVAKVLGMVREMSKVLNGDLEAADKNAFAHYAVDLLEETAGARVGSVARSRCGAR